MFGQPTDTQNESSTDELEIDVDTVAGLFKLYFRELAEPLLNSTVIDALYPLVFVQRDKSGLLDHCCLIAYFLFIAFP